MADWGLTSRKRMLLEDKNFDDCYKKNRKWWADMVLELDEFARRRNEDPLASDIAQAIYPQLLLDVKFVACMTQRGLTADYWYRWFSDYIVHLTWDDVRSAR